MLKNPALPSWKFPFPMKNSSMESSPRIASFPIKKVSLKVSVHFPITNTMRKHRSKFVTCSPSNGTLGSKSFPKTQFLGFLAMLNKMAISEF